MTASGQSAADRSWEFFLLLILVNLLWASQYSAARIATRELGPITVTFLPMAFATVVLGALLVFRRHADGTTTAQRGGAGHQLLHFLVLGVAGTGLAQFGLTAGVKHTLASNASIITLVVPILTALLATALAGEKMNRLIWISFPLAIAGVLMVSSIDWRGVHLGSGKYLLGNALVLLGCFGSAFYNAYSKRLFRLFTPLEVLVYSYLVVDGILFIALQMREPGLLQHLRSAGFAAWLSLVAISVLSLIFSMLLFFWVIARINLTQAALSVYLLPVFGVLISTFALKEKITGRLIVGGGLVFIATFLATTYNQRRRLPESASTQDSSVSTSIRSKESVEC